MLYVISVPLFLACQDTPDDSTRPPLTEADADADTDADADADADTDADTDADADADTDADTQVSPDLPTVYAEADYLEALTLSVGFFGAQRCGDADNWLLTDNPHGITCHLEDGPSAGLDLTGGWHDAGDYIKFSLTNAWAAYALLKAYDAFPDAFPDADENGVPDVLDEVRHATDYLLKLHPDADTLIYRVGGDQDHDLWVTSPYQSTLPVSQGGGKRPVYDGANADIAGLTSAALALMSLKMAELDPAYAATCLAAAQSIYALGDARRRTTSDKHYPDDSWQDDMLCGAVELYRATDEATYLTEAHRWDSALGRHYWVMGWDQAGDLGRHSLAMLPDASPSAAWSAEVAGYLERVSSHEHTDGLAWFDDWGSIHYALNAAFSAALYHQATGEEAWRDFAISQVDWVMGSSSYDRSFIVGYGKNAPGEPHHANAYGREVLDWDLSAPPLHILSGAVVGGPTQGPTNGVTSPGYEDDINDWLRNEVSLSYNTVLVGVLSSVLDLH